MIALVRDNGDLDELLLECLAQPPGAAGRRPITIDERGLDALGLRSGLDRASGAAGDYNGVSTRHEPARRGDDDTLRCRPLVRGYIKQNAHVRRWPERARRGTAANAADSTCRAWPTARRAS